MDSFSDCFTGGGVEAVVEVLEAAGYAPRLLEQDACCGLTWISTGQRAGARRQLEASLDVLHPFVAAGTPIVGLEPSCMAVWRSDAAELVTDPRLPEVAAGIFTLAELLRQRRRLAAAGPVRRRDRRPAALPPRLGARLAGRRRPARLRPERSVTTVGGCCGLAGNFGVEKGHYEVSVRIAEHDLLPAARAHPDAIVLADGFSCRTQLAELAGPPGRHVGGAAGGSMSCRVLGRRRTFQAPTRRQISSTQVTNTRPVTSP